METFRPHPFYPWISVGDQGTVIGERGKPLVIDYSRGRRKKHGFFQVYKNGKREKLGIGQAVLRTHVGPPPEGKTLCCHRDDDPKNNKVDNLYWGDADDNWRDYIRNEYKRLGLDKEE